MTICDGVWHWTWPRETHCPKCVGPELERWYHLEDEIVAALNANKPWIHRLILWLSTRGKK
jgi:hypothetical protein